MSYVFNNLNYDGIIGDKNINYKLAEISQDMWANFTKNGNPSTKDYKWEKYDCKNEFCMIFGKDAELKTNFFDKERNELFFPLLEDYIPYQFSHLSFNVPIVRKGVLIFLALFIIIISILLKKYYIK